MTFGKPLFCDQSHPPYKVPKIFQITRIQHVTATLDTLDAPKGIGAVREHITM